MKFGRWVEVKPVEPICRIEAKIRQGYFYVCCQLGGRRGYLISRNALLIEEIKQCGSINVVEETERNYKPIEQHMRAMQGKFGTKTVDRHSMLCRVLPNELSKGSAYPMWEIIR